MAFTLQQLKTDITSGTLSSTFAPLVSAENWDAIAAMYNDVANGGLIDRNTVTVFDLQSAVVGSEYIALTVGQRDLWNCLIIACSSSSIPLKNSNLRGQVAAVFGAGTTSRTNLLALQQRQGTKAEVLYGDGTVITPSDVFNAVRLP